MFIVFFAAIFENSSYFGIELVVCRCLRQYSTLSLSGQHLLITRSTTQARRDGRRSAKYHRPFPFTSYIFLTSIIPKQIASSTAANEYGNETNDEKKLLPLSPARLDYVESFSFALFFRFSGCFTHIIRFFAKKSVLFIFSLAQRQDTLYNLPNHSMLECSI